MVTKEHPISGYLVTVDGDIYNPKTGYKLKPTISPAGYAKVGTYVCSGGTVHQAVYEAFVGLVPKGLQINHKDGNKLNNHLSNLELVTQRENTLHAYALGLARGLKGEENPQAKLSEEDIKRMYGLFRVGYNNADIAKIFGVHDRYVSLIRHGKRWGHIYEGPFPKSFAYKTSLPNLIEAMELLKSGMTNKEIADKTGIEASNISRLRHGKIWKNFVEFYESRAVTTIP